VSRSIFRGNTSDSGGPAIFVSAGASLSANNCLFVKNSSAFKGGAIAHYGNDLQLLHCTLAENCGSYYGGALYLQGQSASAINCIFWNNQLRYSQGTLERAQIEHYSGPLTLDSCIIQGLDTLAHTNGLAFDPLFVQASANDFRLSANSPAIDNGAIAAAAGPVDLIGAPRLVNGSLDRGAYEFQGAPGKCSAPCFAASLAVGLLRDRGDLHHLRRNQRKLLLRMATRLRPWLRFSFGAGIPDRDRVEHQHLIHQCGNIGDERQQIPRRYRRLSFSGGVLERDRPFHSLCASAHKRSY
jgi:hypothetical protein